MADKNWIVTNNLPICKYCKYQGIVKFGKYKGIQRYYCKSCHRKFKVDDNPFHGKVPSAYVGQAIGELVAGFNLNDVLGKLYREHQYRPSKSLVKRWVIKYTDFAIGYFNHYHPQVESVWICDEVTVSLNRKLRLRVYNIVDEETKYLLASRVVLSATAIEAELIMAEAKRDAKKVPQKVLTNGNRVFKRGIEFVFGADTEHVVSKSVDFDTAGPYHKIYKNTVKIIRCINNIETLIHLNNGWLIYYNYFRIHPDLRGKTPAEAAKIKYDIKNWADLVRSYSN